jgi:hypothetical protein
MLGTHTFNKRSGPHSVHVTGPKEIKGKISETLNAYAHVKIPIISHDGLTITLKAKAPILKGADYGTLKIAKHMFCYYVSARSVVEVTSDFIYNAVRNGSFETQVKDPSKKNVTIKYVSGNTNGALFKIQSSKNDGEEKVFILNETHTGAELANAIYEILETYSQ